MPTITHGRMKAGRTIAVLAGLLALIAIATLTFNVVDEIKVQSSAQSDNVQWSLSQTEVEFQEFTGRLRVGADLASVRRWFDVFYSRIRTVRRAQVFEEVRTSEEFASHLADIERFLDEAVPLIDSGDVALTQNLPLLAAKAQAVRPRVRALANSGLRFFAKKADIQREAVARTMKQLAFALAVLISALTFGIVYMNRLIKQISRRAREQRQTAARINTIMSTSLDGVIVSDADGRITNFNKAAETIFGHRARDVMGKQLGQIIVPDHLRDAHEAGMARMRAGGEKRVVGKGRVQLEAKRSDGTLFPVELAIQSATTDDGDIYIAFLRDVSQRVADEAELIEARDKAIAGEQSRSEFLATMSHEIRTPLNGLLGNMTLMWDTSLSARQQTFLRNMETSGRLLLNHVSDVLDIARYDSGKIQARSEPLHVSALLQDIVDSQSGMALAHRTSLDWGWAGAPQHWINGDSERLQHVLMNLIGNAVKFTKDGRVSVTVSWLDDRIRFEIEDTGIGISDELKGQIFDDFVTGNTSYDRDVSGSGLGLGIVRRFVDVLGGQISFDSTPGEGSTFVVDIPATPSAEQAPATLQQSLPAPQSPKKVLVVEDNEINRFVVRNMLEADGHTVTEAFDGQQGVEKAHAERFDLILMDISMPVLDGRSATQQIRSGNGASARARIVALTANVLPEERADFLALGMEEVLTKPLSKDALRAVLAAKAMPQPIAAATLIDTDHNAETRDMLGEDGYAQMLAKLDEELAALAQWLQTAGPGDAVAERAHKSAGSAAMFGALALASALTALEKRANKAEPGTLPAGLPEVVALCHATRQALAEMAATDPSQPR